ncbi:uncharacterized protein LOC128984304 [Macrosteles quadrilineatus]|uniref:uncharacterized protein LOC128984304 n=1 Tax=Macrosteles quadrilineatus TaxID=74068 RepID=UPI0023E14F60|nr:uncharacterized protein LOC128984304 [Macrosteles quadrilineatus]
MYTLILHSWLLLVTWLALANYSEAAMSMQAFKQAKTMMEGVCQPRTGVDKAFLAQLKKGEFPETDDRKLKCYFECLLRMGNAMQGTKVSGDALRRIARTMVPKQLKSVVMPAIETCQNIDEGDACESAFTFVRCHHKASGPEGFMFS